MSNDSKKLAKEARKDMKRCNFFEWMTAAVGIVLVTLMVGAALAPPPWQVHDSMFGVAKVLLAAMGIFAALQALKYGRDARLTIGKMKLYFDGNGDGKIAGPEDNSSEE